MIYEPRRKLNLKRYGVGDIVRQYRSGDVYRISGLIHRSECVRLLNLITGEEETRHPREFDPVTDPLIVLAAASIE